MEKGTMEMQREIGEATRLDGEGEEEDAAEDWGGDSMRVTGGGRVVWMRMTCEIFLEIDMQDVWSQ
jgi:hypothetical protein